MNIPQIDLTSATTPDLNVRGEFIDPDTRHKLAAIDAALQEDKTIEHMRLMVSTYQKGREYTNFILVAGYAAFFALWTDMAQDIDKPARLLSGGLMSVSLMLFITWEIVKVAANAREGSVLSWAIWGATSRADLANRTKDAAREVEVGDLFIHDLWPVIFLPTVLTGLVGGFILAIAALAEWAVLA